MRFTYIDGGLFWLVPILGAAVAGIAYKTLIESRDKPDVVGTERSA